MMNLDFGDSTVAFNNPRRGLNPPRLVPISTTSLPANGNAATSTPPRYKMKRQSNLTVEL